MFTEVKDTLPISGDDYDAQIIREIKACALDLTTSAEIQLPGTIAITRTQNAQTGVWTITDNSTITDELIIAVITTWCNMRIGNPPNYDQLLGAYEGMKGSMRLSSSYNTPADEEGADTE
jgi:hypothetical protein